MKVAIYRIHYGLDFLEQSINSIIADVDRVFVFHSSRPWSKRTEVTYLGETFPLPQLEEDVEQFIKDKFSNKVTYINRQFDTSHNQWHTLYNFGYNDTWVFDIAQRVDRCHFMPHIIAEHMHFSASKSSFDDTYARNRTQERGNLYHKDKDIYEATREQRHGDAQKLLAVIRSI